MPSKLLTVRVPDDLHETLMQLMEETGLDKTAIVHKLLRLGLNVGSDSSVIQNRITAQITKLDIQELVDERIAKHLTELEKRLTGSVTEQLGEFSA